MPNHIESKLEITGLLPEIEKLITFVSNEEQEFTCDKIIPMPPTIYRGSVLGDAEKKKYGKNNWYDWRVENWGSKWDVYDVCFHKEEISNTLCLLTDNKIKVTVTYYFNTAWSPIDKVIAKLSEIFPTLKMKYGYLDEGYGFWGLDYYQKGNKVKTFDKIKTVKAFLKR